MMFKFNNCNSIKVKIKSEHKSQLKSLLKNKAFFENYKGTVKYKMKFKKNLAKISKNKSKSKIEKKKLENSYYPNYVSSFYGAHRNLLDVDGFKRMNSYSLEHRKEIIQDHNEKMKKTYKASAFNNHNVALKIIKD